MHDNAVQSDLLNRQGYRSEALDTCLSVYEDNKERALFAAFALAQTNNEIDGIDIRELLELVEKMYQHKEG